MNFLGKNLVKLRRKKVIVDIGKEHTKLMCARCERNKITITHADELHIDNALNRAPVLATQVSEFIRETKIGKCDVLLSLPSSVVASRIVAVKNIKRSALDKHVKTEYYSFSRVNPGNIDWAYLGEREENGDTVSYVLIGAVSKTLTASLIEEFYKRDLKITTITFALYNRINLSDLFRDYEYRNKIFVDDSKMIVFLDGVAVYARDTSVNSIIEDVSRVLLMFEQDYQTSITKVICGGALTDGIINALADNNYISAERFSMDELDIAEGSGYSLVSTVSGIHSEYNSAVGLVLGEVL